MIPVAQEQYVKGMRGGGGGNAVRLAGVCGAQSDAQERDGSSSAHPGRKVARDSERMPQQIRIGSEASAVCRGTRRISSELIARDGAACRFYLIN